MELVGDVIGLPEERTRVYREAWQVRGKRPPKHIATLSIFGVASWSDSQPEIEIPTCSQVLGDVDVLDKLHLHEATGQYRDYGLHSEVGGLASVKQRGRYCLVPSTCSADAGVRGAFLYVNGCSTHRAMRYPVSCSAGDHAAARLAQVARLAVGARRASRRARRRLSVAQVQTARRDRGARRHG